MPDRKTHEDADSLQRDLEAEIVIDRDRGPIDLREFRRQVSAAKARDCFDDQGRGVLLSRLLDGDEFGAWFSALPGNKEVWAHWYVPLTALDGAPNDLLRLVQSYDPLRQAVVLIERAPGDLAPPEIINLHLPEDNREDENDEADPDL